jgi:PAS domain S-box-containing protein
MTGPPSPDSADPDQPGAGRASAARQESEDPFRVMADCSPVIMWLTDMAGRVEYANRAYREFFDLEPAQTIRFDWGAQLHPDDAEAYIAAFKTAVESRRPFHARARLRRADGQWRWIESSGTPRIDSSGRAIGFAGTSSDITEIYESREALRETDRRKNEFLATLAHELRNPLAPARNSLQIMRMARHDPEIMERALGTLERQIAHMVRLIDDLVDVSRISRGMIELRRERVDLAAVLNNAVEASRPLLDQYGHTFTLKLPGEPLFVDGDPVRLGQIFSNLLHNAAKYTGKGGRIHLSATRRAGDVIVRVEDNGVGIPDAMLPRIFDMFAQVDRSLDRYSGGLGIGLSVVKRLVEMHEGSVQARSDGPGRGTEFIVQLPISMVSGGSWRPPEPAPEVAEPVKRRILIAEDNEDTAVSLATILRIMGNEVRTVGDGLEAVARGRSFQPDVVLLDIGMPRLNGYEACRLIRAEPWGNTAVVIAVTGWGQEEDRKMAAEVGFDHYLVKPVETAALAKLLKTGRTAAPETQER